VRIENYLKGGATPQRRAAGAGLRRR